MFGNQNEDLPRHATARLGDCRFNRSQTLAISGALLNFRSSFTEGGMSCSEYWAKPKVVREQAVLFAPTLDDMISADHEVRLLDEVLRSLD